MANSDIVNRGQAANDGTGDALRNAFGYINTRFQQLLGRLNYRGDWVAGTVYNGGTARDWFTESGTAYIVTTTHTAGVFADDLAAGLFASQDAAQILLDLATPGTGTGGEMVATDIDNVPSAAGGVGWAIQSMFSGVSVLKAIPVAEWDAIRDGTSTYDATAAIQSVIDGGATDVTLPQGTLCFTQIVFRTTLRRFTGRGQATGGVGTYLKRLSGATGPAIKWDSPNRIIGATIGGFRMDGNSEAVETYGLDLSGFSYCTFEDIWVRLFYLDGIYADGSITPTNQQYSNNTFINVRGNNNLRDGWRFDGSSVANSANTYIGCEGAGNGGIGFDELVGYSNETIGCTFQGNTGKDVYINGSRGVHSFYAEGAAKAVLLGTSSVGNAVSCRSSFPLWNTFDDNGVQNRVSIRGEVQPEKQVFFNAYLQNWLGVSPDGVTLNGAATLANYTDTGNPYGASVEVTIGANLQGLIFTPLETAANLQGRWVTLLLEVDTSGVTDPFVTRTYARDGVTLNSASGEFASENLHVTASGTYKVLAYDVKFAASVSGAPTIIWYAAYSGFSAGGQPIKIRSVRLVMGQTRECAQFVGDLRDHSTSTAALSAASNGINQHLKRAGRLAYETSTGKLRFAVGTGATSAWRATDGSGDVTPS
jgi:hypothetical protein